MTRAGDTRKNQQGRPSWPIALIAEVAIEFRLPQTMSGTPIQPQREGDRVDSHSAGEYALMAPQALAVPPRDLDDVLTAERKIALSAENPSSVRDGQLSLRGVFVVLTLICALLALRSWFASSLVAGACGIIALVSLFIIEAIRPRAVFQLMWWSVVAVYALLSIATLMGW